MPGDGSTHDIVGSSDSTWCAWRLPHGELHRDADAPALIFIWAYGGRHIRSNGHREWFRHGKRHRDGDAPAVITCIPGPRWWCQDDNMHRDGDAPALIRPEGHREWWRHGKRHRDGDAPAMFESDGRNRLWYRHDAWIVFFKASWTPARAAWAACLTWAH